MNRRAIFIFIFVYFGLLNLSAQQKEVQPVRFNKLSEGLYEILGGQGANGGLYIGDNGVLIIDAKQDKKSVEQVIEGLKKITDKPLRYLVNTHSDGDHVRGNQYFPESVTFISHENCRKEFFHAGRDGTPSEWSKPELASYIPSITFSDKMDIYLGSKKVELLYFGVGHTTGDGVVYFPEEKIAFIGDQIFITRPQLIHAYKGGNSFENVKTLTKMLETIDAEKFCSGHSEIANRENIREHIKQMKNRQEKVKALIEKGKNVEDVKSEFPKNESALIETIYNEIKGK